MNDSSPMKCLLPSIVIAEGDSLVGALAMARDGGVTEEVFRYRRVPL